MKRIAIDMDDVMADASGRFIEYAFNKLGRKLEKHHLEGRDWATVVGMPHEDVRSWLFEAGFFKGMQVMPDCKEVMEELTKKYEVFIVSAAIEFPESLKEKVEWLAEHFPFISWKHIVLCGHKYMIKADFLIDDHEKNLINFTEGTPILFTAPHNLQINSYKRVNNWTEVGEMFL